MEKRTLGRTGHESTVVTFGTAGIGRVTQDVADKAIQLVLDHGVNHIDIAPSYGEAMERMAPWMPDIRDRVFLGSKTRFRTRDEAWADIESIMKRLNVDSFDLLQLHGVIDMDALDQVTAPGGALEALVEMREQGLTKWLGITGHGPFAPSTHLEGLQRFDFDTIMFPLNAAMFKNADYRRDAEALLAEANSRNLGIQTIKMIARGGWGDGERDAATWYDPHRDQEPIDRALWWVLSQQMHTAPSAGDVDILPKVLDAAERFSPLSAEKQEAVIDSQHPPLPHPELAIPA
ncbi:MAG: aldo/keto reductase [SAR202 cluster bacterium]|nr:aldo/keto reductase [SAR202 cluster bacterium]MDP6512544.1 aldo/keto reductase [SAR202 cluster bacterium]MDP6713030.1 aldo/keto reductase [SAR202 cluster bacterium]